jgi:F0F1-type ATP synthase epsilon subunit
METGSVFTLEIISPTQSQLFEVTGIEVKGIGGSFFIAKDHAPLVSLLQPAERMVITTSQGTTQEIPVTGGIISVEGDRAVVIFND